MVKPVGSFNVDSQPYMFEPFVIIEGKDISAIKHSPINF